MLAPSLQDDCVPRTLQQILDERVGALVGRDQELGALLELLNGGTPLVAVVHGVAGVGKSTLLRAFCARARAQNARVVQLDASTIEPTERGFLTVLAAVLEEPIATVEDAADRLGVTRPEGSTAKYASDSLRRLWPSRAVMVEPAALLPHAVRIGWHMTGRQQCPA